jgi:Holliday junction resolvasome RuvABC endonuclease subunit
MKILALDPATFCGFAHSDGPPSRENESLVSGVWRLSVHDAEHPGQRMVRLRDFIYDAAEKLGFDKIAFEDAGFGSHNPSIQAFHANLAGVLMRIAAEYGVPIYRIGPTTLKLWSTGDGRAKKPAMIRACKTHYGILPRSDDEADALLVLGACFQNVTSMRPKKPKPRRASNPREARLF